MVEEGLDENVLDVYDMGETQVIRVDYVRYIEWFRRKESGEDIEALSKEMEKEGEKRKEKRTMSLGKRVQGLEK